jgi:hypothetical protein
MAATRTGAVRGLSAQKGAGPQYLEIQNRFRQANVRSDPGFQKAFNRFYRVRRNQQWRDEFFRLLESGKERSLTFVEVLDHLFRFCGRYEASCASKLVATLNPNLPVVDSIVLGNIGEKLPPSESLNRRARILELYDRMREMFEKFLRTETGVYLVEQFQQRYTQEVTETKMLDLVLWRSGRKPVTMGPASKQYLKSSAVLSADGRYRYELARHISHDPATVLFIGLNPSSATAAEDDPTVRREVGFARR